MEQESRHIKIAVVDDHAIFRAGLTGIIEKCENYSVAFEAGNGNELIKFMNAGMTPDLIFLDLNMPEMDGFETSEWLWQNYPGIPILMITMYDTDITLLSLLQNGVRGFLKKNVAPADLKHAIANVLHTGFYHTNSTTGKLIGLFRRHQENSAFAKRALTNVEIAFLRYACSELTYKQIANEMNLNPRAIDNLRDNLFDKLEVKSRPALAILAAKHCIYKI